MSPSLGNFRGRRRHYRQVTRAAVIFIPLYGNKYYLYSTVQYSTVQACKVEADIKLKTHKKLITFNARGVENSQKVWGIRASIQARSEKNSKIGVLDDAVTDRKGTLQGTLKPSIKKKRGVASLLHQVHHILSQPTQQIVYNK